MPEQDPCLSLQPCQKNNAPCAGVWRLAPRRAIRLMPRRPSQILIVQGHAWITWESGEGANPGAELDRFLAAGQMLEVPAGVHLVMESVDADLAVDFDWRTVPPELVSLPSGSLPVLLRCWCQAWLGLAQASGRLAWGLVQRLVRVRRWRSAPGPAH